VTSSLSDATDARSTQCHHFTAVMTGWTHFRYAATVCDLMTMPSTSLLAFDWEPTYMSLVSALAERPLTQEDCMACRAEGTTVAVRGTTAWTISCGERWRRHTFRR